MNDTVLAEVRDGVLRLVLNRPDKLNSFNQDMHMALRAGLLRAQEDDFDPRRPADRSGARFLRRAGPGRP